MKMFDILKNDYFRLFVKREGKVVLGKNFSNLWLLTAVLTATFLAIAFSNGSLDYLSYKMDDPFINWVDIKNEYGEGDFYGLEYALDSEENKEKYHYSGYQGDFYTAMMFYGRTDDNVQYLKCRFFQDLNTPLVEKILEDDNVVRNWKVEDLAAVHPNTIGVVITEEAMKKLGYDKAPSFIDHQRWSEGTDATEYGFDMPDEGFVRLPVPVLAVVKRLPGNVDLISGSYFYKQYNNDDTFPFYLCKENYARTLCYFIPSEVETAKVKAIVDKAASKLTEAEIVMDELSFYVPEIQPFRQGTFVVFDCYDDYLSYSSLKEINAAVMDSFKDNDVHRVFSYEFSDYELSQRAYISVHFNDLHKLRDFESYIRDNFKVKIEMSQINAKENFNAVSTMGHILSWGIIVFAIVCIILFIVNLLQSYFQKVKRNLGTFKAFGISNRDLISVYVLIMSVIIIAAIVMSVSATWLVQGTMHVCGILKDGVFDYLSLWSYKTVSSIVIIVFASVYTVYAVMHRLLKATPGDLIYDRQ
ncbi:MAG: ABC transporter permease [Bacteroidales bacterium]|nr:ABC transporter permease [Bacteroidales bacterium]